jgi:Ca-activated chloride channel family protein
VPSVIRQSGRVEILNTQIAGEEVSYLTGGYQIETLTLPRRKYKVTIEEKKTSTITIPAPGLVNLNTIAVGYGDLYEIFEGNEQVWVCSLSEKSIQQSYSLLPGTYKAVFRVRETTGSKYTATKTFALTSGQTITVNIFN